MPDIVRLRYTGPGAVAVPALGREVSPDDVVELPGKLVTVDGNDNPLPADHDAIVVEFGNPPTIRAFPTSVWALAKKSSAATAADAKADADEPTDSTEESK